MDNLKVNFVPEVSKPALRPQLNHYNLTHVQPRGDPMQNLHIPTVKINFTSKAKPETSKSSGNRYLYFEPTPVTQRPAEISLEKTGVNNINYYSVSGSMTKRTKAEEKKHL